jgi:prepilin-type N-terminal cleavage/methylation domain-containing protein
MKSIQRTDQGFTMIEVLVAIFLSSVIAASGFEFYKTMHGTTITQEDITEMQQNCRASIEEISRNVRMAGYKLPAAHDPYYISGDTLIVYYSNTNPVDTVRYYLSLRPGSETFPDDWKPYRLMRQVNSSAETIFADDIRSATFTLVDSSNIDITLVSQTSKSDVQLAADDGFRSFTLSERIVMRNISL